MPLCRPILGFFTAALIFSMVVGVQGYVNPAPAYAQPAQDKPYDQKLFRLAELLGAVHYLRELCGAKDGQTWRENMKELIESEGLSLSRKATLSRRFNRGYRGYSRTYRSCTSSAQATIERFITEAIDISDELGKLGQ